ncbi:MAG: hypothetical protein LBH04_00135 [Tannerellaceae bacterium]|nr:hypothetical protein [Tannerellaceae bacterium]
MENNEWKKKQMLNITDIGNNGFKSMLQAFAPCPARRNIFPWKGKLRKSQTTVNLSIKEFVFRKF